MPWAEKLESGRYRAVYRDRDGKKQSAGTHAHKATAVRAAHDAAATEKPVGSDMPWAQWEPIWQARRTVEAGTVATDEPKLKTHVRPKWGAVPLAEITHDAVQAWVVQLGKPVAEGGSGIAPNTVRKVFYLLSGSLKAASLAGAIPKNPCQGVRLPKPGPTPDRFLESEEYDAIRATLDDFDSFVADMLIGTGARWGEVVGIHWEHVDLKRRELSIEWAWDRETLAYKPPKDHQRRVIPIGDRLAGALAERLERVGYGEPAPVPYREGRKVRSGLVLAHTDGRPPDGGNFRRRFEAATRVAWVGRGKSRRKVGHVRVHDLRHTYASRLLRAGVPIEVVSKLLGHATIGTTQRYAHLAESRWDQVRAALG